MCGFIDWESCRISSSDHFTMCSGCWAIWMVWNFLTLIIVRNLYLLGLATWSELWKVRHTAELAILPPGKASSSHVHSTYGVIVISYYMNQKKTLEINPRHPLMKELLRRVEVHCILLFQHHGHVTIGRQPGSNNCGSCPGDVWHSLPTIRIWFEGMINILCCCAVQAFRSVYTWLVATVRYWTATVNIVDIIALLC